MPIFFLLGSLLFITFAAAIAWWTLEPINRVAGRLQFSTRFMLSDYLGLMILLQIPLAAAGRAIGTSGREDSNSYWLLLLLASVLMFVLWMASVSVVSRAGITRIWRRLCVIVLLVPGTLGLIVGWPLGFGALYTWITLSPRNLLNVPAVLVMISVLAGLNILIRALAYWSLVGSPGEEILAELRRGRTQSWTSG